MKSETTAQYVAKLPAKNDNYCILKIAVKLGARARVSYTLAISLWLYIMHYRILQILQTGCDFMHVHLWIGSRKANGISR